MHSRLYQLDILRFFAAMAVVLFHFGIRGWNNGSDLQHIRYEELAHVAQYGFLGVQLFFIISGYVISMSVDGRSAFEFAIFRALRLYPAYWVAVPLTFATVMLLDQQHLMVDTKSFLMNFTMLQSFFGFSHVDGVYWTLVIELQFYGLMFLLVFLGLRRFLLNFLYLWLFICVFITILYPQAEWLKIPRFLFFPIQAPYFILGSCFYLLHKKLNASLATWALLLLTFAYCLYSIPELLTIGSVYAIKLNIYIMYALIVAFFGLFMLLITGRLNWINYPQLKWLGALTYPIYLLHENIGFSIINAYFTEEYKYPQLALLIVLLLTLSWAVNQFVEEPVTRFMKPKMLAWAHALKEKGWLR